MLIDLFIYHFLGTPNNLYKFLGVVEC